MRAESFARFAGQLRVLGAAVVLASKLAGIGAIGLAWMIAADAMRVVSAEGYATVAGAALLTSVVSMCITAHWRRWRLIAPLTGLVLSAGLFAGWMWLTRRDYGYAEGDLPAPVRVICTMAAPAFAVGGILGVALWIFCERTCERLSVRGALVGAFPAIGSAEDGGYRPAVDALLARADDGLARTLVSFRGIALAGMVVLVASLCWSWADYLRNRPGAFTIGNVAVWVICGGIVGGMLSLLIMPAGRWRSALYVAGILLGSLVLGGLGHCILTRTPLLMHVQMAPMLAIGALAGAVSSLVVQSFVAFVIRGILPVPIQKHLLGEMAGKAPASEATQASAESCEECGYQLDGLPTSTCEGCATVLLRCPECGHQQPAGTLHARMLHRLRRWNTSVRIGNLVVALGLGGLLLIPWFAAGAQSEHLFGSSVSWRDLLGICLVTLLAIMPLRLMVMHTGSWLGGLLLTIALPTMAATLGHCLSGWSASGAEQVYGVLVPIWALCAVVAPVIWRGWLMLMLPRRAAAMAYRWQASSGFRWRAGNMNRAFFDDVGTEVRLPCHACGAEVSPLLSGPCAQCGVMLASCAACPTRTPVTQIRAAFESLVGRVRSVALARISAVGFVAFVICGIISMSSAISVRQGILYPSLSRGIWGEFAGGMVAVAVCGAIVGVVLTNRGKVIAAVCALGHFVLFGILLMTVVADRHETSWEDMSIPMVVLGTLSAAAFISALLAGILFDLSTRVLVPRASARALLAWLGGRSSLDQAAALSREGL